MIRELAAAEEEKAKVVGKFMMVATTKLSSEL